MTEPRVPGEALPWEPPHGQPAPLQPTRVEWSTRGPPHRVPAGQSMDREITEHQCVDFWTPW